MTDATLRLDRFLWHARLARTRTHAREIAASGHIRLNGRRVERGHAPVRIGDVLSLPLPRGVTVVRIESLPPRRISAKQAAEFCTVLSDTKR
ncbi:MAG: RNA-binding S4 domain-containing protein [Sphingomonadales bacterium]|nr:RNA-binding S4 domain-containing protein [Sphingomonadales bacterium]